MFAKTANLASRLLARGSHCFSKRSDELQLRNDLIGQCPAKLNFGCGHNKRKEYLNVDVDPACSPDVLIVNGDYSAIPRRRFTEVLAKDVVEHVPRARTLDLLLDFAEYLIDGGKLIIETTSILHVAAKLKEANQYADHHSWTICLFGNQEHPGDFHYTGFTDVSLQIHLIAAGFTIETLELREGWMYYVEAKKTSDWTSILGTTSDLTDLEFVQRAHQAAFDADADETDLGDHGNALREGLTRKRLLKQLFSSPERLFKTAEKNEHLIQRMYTLNNARTHNDARIRTPDAAIQSRVLEIETDSARWSYAVSFALDTLPRLGTVDEMRIVVDLEVMSGAIGIACTTGDQASFVDREELVSTGIRRKIIVSIGPPLAARHLMFRNASPDGRSLARIYSIEIRCVMAVELV